MLIVVVVVFVFCWFLVYVYYMILVIDFSVWELLLYYFMLLCYWCGYVNSVVNLWFLIYFKKKFCVVFKRMIIYLLLRILFVSKNNESVRSVIRLFIRDLIV